MNRGRATAREPAEELALLIIHNRGRKAIRDEDLAHRFGLSVEQMYRRLGRKLLQFSRGSWFELQPEKRHEKRHEKHTSAHSRPAIAFTLSGVVMVSASLRMEHALAVGMAIVPLLRTRRRSSRNRQRRPRRADDPPRQAKYDKVFAQLQAELSKLLKRQLSAGSGPTPSGSPRRSKTRSCRAP